MARGGPPKGMKTRSGACVFVGSAPRLQPSGQAAQKALHRYSPFVMGRCAAGTWPAGRPKSVPLNVRFFARRDDSSAPKQLLRSQADDEKQSFPKLRIGGQQHGKLFAAMARRVAIVAQPGPWELATKYDDDGEGDIPVLIPSNVSVTRKRQSKMFRTTILATGLIALVPAASMSLIAAQSQSPKARSASVFSQSRSYLGIGVVDLTDERAKTLGLKEPQGVEVTSVTEDSPAYQAGIRQGDVILEYNGQHVEGGEQFVRMVQETPAGRKAAMQVWRNGSAKSVTATIGSRQERLFRGGGEVLVPGAGFSPFPPGLPAIPDTPYDMFSWRSTTLGVETEALNSQLAEFFGVKEGVLVRAVTRGSAAETAGLKAGDVITKVDGQAVSSPRNITPFLRHSGRSVTLTVVRNHKELTLNVKLAKDLQRYDESFPGLHPESREIL